MFAFIYFYFYNNGGCLIVIVFLKFGNLFFKGLSIYLFVEESFHEALKYLFYSFLIFDSNSNNILFFYYI